MDLWIRSQDKIALEKPVQISVDYLIKSIVNPKKGADCIIKINNKNFGYYETERRAIEVLDEIQKLLAGSSRIILQPKITPINHELLDYVNKELKCDACIVPQEFDCLAVNQSVVVYEMPKE